MNIIPFVLFCFFVFMIYILFTDNLELIEINITLSCLMLVIILILDVVPSTEKIVDPIFVFSFMFILFFNLIRKRFLKKKVYSY